jgi:hypothetical protein
MESNTFLLDSFKLGLVLDCQLEKLAEVDVEFKLEVWRWGIRHQEMACRSTRFTCDNNLDVHTRVFE